MAAAVATDVSSMKFYVALLGGVIDVPEGVRDFLGGLRELCRGVVDQEGGDWEAPMFPRTRAMATASVLVLSFFSCLFTLFERDW